MLNTFFYWAQETIASLPAGIEARLTPGVESGNTAARVDFDTASHVGRITCWDSGHFYAEILEAASGENLLDQHGNADSAADLNQLFLIFLEKLRPSPDQ